METKKLNIIIQGEKDEITFNLDVTNEREAVLFFTHKIGELLPQNTEPMTTYGIGCHSGETSDVYLHSVNFGSKNGN